ncbi:MAG: hypothetical protein H3C47_07785 [Candidatus Cloacimonetes bacterium]|nr:hypothetical protein [Candidatus Cloacimonadota bacterium]
MLQQEVILVLTTRDWVLLVLRVGLFSSSLVDSCSLSRGSVSELMYRLDSIKVHRVSIIGEDEDSILDRDLLAALKVRHQIAYSVSLGTVLQRLLLWDFPDGGTVLFQGAEVTHLVSLSRFKQTLSLSLPVDPQELGVALGNHQDLTQSGLPLLLDDSLLVHLDMFSSIWTGPIYSCSQLKAYSRIYCGKVSIKKNHLSLLTVIQQLPDYKLGIKITQNTVLVLMISILLCLIYFLSGWSKVSEVKADLALPLAMEETAELKRPDRPDVLPHPLCPMRYHGLRSGIENRPCGIFSACVQDIVLCAGDSLGDWQVETIQEESALILDGQVPYEIFKSERLLVPIGISLFDAKVMGSKVEASATTAIPAIGLKPGDRLDGFLGKQFVNQEQIKELEVLLRSGLEFTPVPK